MEALAFVRKEYPDAPFILVSGTIGEQAAIESLKAGATDYVLKHNPERLASAVRRAAQEAAERAKRRQAETELVRREKYFRTLTENSLDILCILSREGQFLYTSPSVERVLGYAPEELHGKDSFARVHPEDLPLVRGGIARGDGTSGPHGKDPISLSTQRTGLEADGTHRPEPPGGPGHRRSGRPIGAT